MMNRAKDLILVLPLIGAIACGAPAAPPGAAPPGAAPPGAAPPSAAPPRPAVTEKEPSSEEAAAPGENTAEPSYPEIEPKDLGKINGKPALFKHAYITMSEGPGSAELQAFTYAEVAASEVCPHGLRFISEGAMLQVTFLGKKEMTDLSRFYLQTEKPDVKVTKAVAKLRGVLEPGTKVPVEVTIEGSNGTKLQGVIDAVVCHPPKQE